MNAIFIWINYPLTFRSYQNRTHNSPSNVSWFCEFTHTECRNALAVAFPSRWFLFRGVNCKPLEPGFNIWRRCKHKHISYRHITIFSSFRTPPDQSTCSAFTNCCWMERILPWACGKSTFRTNTSGELFSVIFVFGWRSDKIPRLLYFLNSSAVGLPTHAQFLRRFWFCLKNILPLV